MAGELAICREARPRWRNPGNQPEERPGDRSEASRDEGRCSVVFSMISLILVPVNTHCHSDFRVSPAAAPPLFCPPPPPPPPRAWKLAGRFPHAVRDPGLLNSWISQRLGQNFPSSLSRASLPPPIYWRGKQKTFNSVPLRVIFLGPSYTQNLPTLVSYLIPRPSSSTHSSLALLLQGTQRPNRGMPWSLHSSASSDACSPDLWGPHYRGSSSHSL